MEEKATLMGVYKLTNDNFYYILNMLGKHPLDFFCTNRSDDKFILVRTPEGEKELHLGDYLVRFYQGRYFVFKEKEFNAIWEQFMKYWS